MFWKLSSSKGHKHQPSAVLSRTQAGPWVLLLCSNEQFVINMNPIRLSSSMLLLISSYLPAPVVLLFMVSSPKLLSPWESSTAEGGKGAFSPLSQESLSDTSAKLQNLVPHHFACTVGVRVKQMLLPLKPINTLQKSGFGKSFIIFHSFCIFTEAGEQNKLFSRMSE